MKKPPSGKVARCYRMAVMGDAHTVVSGAIQYSVVGVAIT